MDIRRVILYAALVLIVYSLWTNWQADYLPKTATQSVSTNASLPVGPTTSPQEPILQSQDGIEQESLVHVKTDVLHLSIDLNQGAIVQAELLNYPLSVDEKNKPFTLLQVSPTERYVANSNLIAVNGQKIDALKINYKSAQTTYELGPDQQQLIVTLQGDSDGLAIEKQFIFNRASYLIDVRYQLMNKTPSLWKGYLNTQLLRASPQEDKSSMFHVGSFTGASYSNPGQKKYQKVNFKEMQKANLNVEAKGGWVAMQQHYFLTAWIPEPTSHNRFYTQANQNTYTIGAVSAPISIAADQKAEVGTRLYVGPEITDVLKNIAPGLDMTVDYGMLWILSSLLFSLLKSIYSVIGNWGWSIVLVTVLIKLAFYRLSATSYRSMASMRKLQPKLQALKERYGDDKAKMSQATMELYRQEKVNPLGGCLPIIVQIPVFIALYWVLLESVELRQAPFILWIKDLATSDPYHILPIIMGATLLIQQKLNPAPPDPMQAKVMMFLPILFTAIFWNFPAGLVLYWIVNNTLSILQQWYITRKYSDHPKNKLAIAK